MFRSKIIISSIIFLILLIFTSIIKNQTRIVEKKLYKLNKKIALKEKDINESQLDFYFLTSPAEVEKKINILEQVIYMPI
jgi:cell division protein FtsL